MAGMRPLKLPSVSSTRDYSSIDPLDGRYYDPAIAQYLSERSRIAYQAHVEIALAYTLAEHTVCSLRVAQQIEKAAQSVSAEAVYEAEKLTRHDIKALGDCIKATLPDSAKPYVHFGATSYDIICTASALQLRDGMQKVVLPRLNELLQTLVELSETYALSVQIGRTHGQHAVPITFGFAIAEYVSRLGHSITVLTTSTHELYGKFSGAVGSYNALSMFITNPQDFEKKLLARLHLKPAPYSTQIIPAENTVRLLDELSLINVILGTSKMWLA
jgi:adenylosuccinate lyase